MRSFVSKRLASFCVRLYKTTISPAIHWLAGPGAGCRYHPTCSEYMGEALETHGIVIGFWMGCRRLLRCHPWGGSGWDPVPTQKFAED